ncbi:alpha/beta hydrolase [uncultured Paludibaculum sp.]|uniref:alpha/beta fold hydrolase n=1 Tax=uncultured Paludibaculum sp. TaxID=1765020 RepID=UPI002AAB46AE|nr:alpha/beta hydrolase [uncultured Paludibaculum sp.]
MHPAAQQGGKRLRSWVRFAIAGASAFAVVAGIGAMYQNLASDRDWKLVPPPGVRVDVGGYRMHMLCMGVGGPTVVLDSGLGDYSIHWRRVQGEIAGVTRTCSYDRAGLGWSDPSPRVRTSAVIAEELHTLLHRAGIRPPYILVGHSMGGLHVRMFQRLYPSETEGMTLIDSSHPDQDGRFPPSITAAIANYQEHLRRMRLLMPFGIPRLFRWCGEGNPELQPALRANACRTAAIHETVAESEAFNSSANEVRAAGWLGELPLVVISEDPAKNAPEGVGVFEAMQSDLAGLSSHSARIVAIGSGHQIHWERPDLVVSAIRAMVAEIRHAQP